MSSMHQWYIYYGRLRLKVHLTYLLDRFEDVAAAQLRLNFARNVAEYSEILSVMRHVENPVKGEQLRSWTR